MQIVVVAATCVCELHFSRTVSPRFVCSGLAGSSRNAAGSTVFYGERNYARFARNGLTLDESSQTGVATSEHNWCVSLLAEELRSERDNDGRNVPGYQPWSLLDS